MAEAIIRRVSLPSRATPAVRPGSEVGPETVIARRRLPGPSFSVPVAGPLHRRAAEAATAILARPGAAVLVDQPIARAGRHEVRSPQDAIFIGYSSVDGTALLASAGPAEQILGHVQGLVESVSPQAIAIRVVGARLASVGGGGAPVHGTLLMGVATPADELRPNAIDAGAEGRIVVGGAWASAETLTRARAIGVAGIVVGGLHARSLADVAAGLSRRRALGAEQGDFGILVVEGFGRVGLEPALFAWLAAQEGRQACLSGAEHDLIVQGAPPAPRRRRPPAVGERVVGVRRPTLGMTGVLTSVLSNLHAPSSGILAASGMVRLDDGRLVPVPLANLEAVLPG